MSHSLEEDVQKWSVHGFYFKSVIGCLYGDMWADHSLSVCQQLSKMKWVEYCYP